VEKCEKIPDSQSCKAQCDSVYDDYEKMLVSRYEGERKDLIDKKVKNCKITF
jgi:hypothetical protein